jgi:tetratricopeptide (TPR) repeat protein
LVTSKGGKLGLFDFFKKPKSEEEQFQEAVASKDYFKIAEIGKKIIKRNPNSLSILNFYVDALVRLGKKKEALQSIIEFAEKKIREEYYDIAIAVLKKALRIDPFNVKVLRLLAHAYEKKGLYYEAFKLLINTYKTMVDASTDTTRVVELIQELLEKKFHPFFYEKYADLLAGNGNLEEAFKNYVLAGNMYINLKDYKGALRSLFKARNIRRTENMDRQLVEVVSHLKGEDVSSILLKILETNASNPEFLKFVIETFRSSGSLESLRKVASVISSPKAKYYLLSGISFEEGEVEEAKEYLQRLKMVDDSFYNSMLSFASSRYDINISSIDSRQVEKELPEVKDILEAFDEALNVNDLISDYVDDISLGVETFRDVDREVEQIEKDGTKYISLAEAMLGLEKYQEAIENAKKVLKNSKHFLKAVSIIVQSLKSLGRYNEALEFLTDILQREDLTSDKAAKIKALMGEIYEALGEKDRALLWYKEANKDLHEEELSRKIALLSTNR